MIGTPFFRYMLFRVNLSRIAFELSDQVGRELTVPETAAFRWAAHIQLAAIRILLLLWVYLPPGSARFGCFLCTLPVPFLLYTVHCGTLYQHAEGPLALISPQVRDTWCVILGSSAKHPPAACTVLSLLVIPVAL